MIKNKKIVCDRCQKELQANDRIIFISDQLDVIETHDGIYHPYLIYNRATDDRFIFHLDCFRKIFGDKYI